MSSIKIKNKFSLKKAILIVFIIICLFVFFTYQNKHLVISNFIYKSAEVGSDLDDYKIVQISDLHNATFGKNNSNLIKKIKDCSPNIIVITGDIVDSNHTDIECALLFAKEIVKIAPVYYITGNHEYWLDDSERTELLNGLVDLGVVDLNNDKIKIKNGESSFSLIGLDDNNLNDNTLNSLIEDSESLSIVLAHEPQYIQNYAESNADLILSGHAHGGQFRLPFIRGIVAPDQGFFPKYTSGEYNLNQTEMIVSRGLGNSIIPIRLFNYPEIVCIELKHS